MASLLLSVGKLVRLGMKFNTMQSSAGGDKGVKGDDLEDLTPLLFLALWIMKRNYQRTSESSSAVIYIPTHL